MQESFTFSKEIPEKLYYKIREVAKILSVEPYVLRFWESEFKSIRPNKSKSGQRLYRVKDIENLQLIKKLLYEEKFTIAGARQRLKEMAVEQKQKKPAGKESLKMVLKTVRQELKELIDQV